MLEIYTPKGADRNLEIKVIVTKRLDSGEQKTTYEAKLDGETLSFGNITSFLKKIETINNIVFEAEKDESFVEFEIVRFDYQRGEKIEDGRMVNYDRWEYRGYPAYDLNGIEVDERGIYLTPDKRYTDEYHDIWYDFTIASITA